MTIKNKQARYWIIYDPRKNIAIGLDRKSNGITFETNNLDSIEKFNTYSDAAAFLDTQINKYPNWEVKEMEVRIK